MLLSDGYDVAQTALCFLYQFIGKKVSDIYGNDRRGKEIIIKLACYWKVDGELMRYRRKMENISYIDFNSYKALPMDPVNCFEKEQTDYNKYNTLVEALCLTELELAILNCYMNGMRQSEVCAELGIGRDAIHHRKASIQKRCYTLYGAYLFDMFHTVKKCSLLVEVTTFLRQY